jgi:hypothetical protein
MSKLDKLLHGHVGKLFGTINASHGFLMNLRMAHIGWRVFATSFFFLKSFLACGSICTHNSP